MTYRRVWKRGFDWSGALALSVLLLPVFVCISVASLFAHGGKILFRQERVGRYGRRFRMLKFRTMNDRRDAGGKLLPDEARVTPFGRFLRRSSLDELPQIAHIFTGKMSLVGPRPLLPEHVADCSPGEFRRHDVRPGITGLAQVKGRNDIPFSSRFRYDVFYVKKMNPGLDLQILWHTFPAVFPRRERVRAAAAAPPARSRANL